jgi:hypothetical protein
MSCPEMCSWRGMEWLSDLRRAPLCVVRRRLVAQCNDTACHHSSVFSLRMEFRNYTFKQGLLSARYTHQFCRLPQGNVRNVF